MIRLKEIVLSKNNIRQAMLDEFGINGMNDAVLPLPGDIYQSKDDPGIAFKVIFGAEYRWIEEFRHIEKGQFPGVHVFRNRMGTFNKLYFDSHFDMNNLHRQVSDRGEMTLGDLVGDLIQR